jgi:hypothetical protein
MPMPKYFEGLRRITDLAELDVTGAVTESVGMGLVADSLAELGGSATESVGVGLTAVDEVVSVPSVTIPAAMTHFWPMIFYVAGMTRSLLRVRRSSDNTEQDFAWGSNGLVDTPGILSFCGGGSGFVSKAYHINNATYDLVQATTSLQPRIVNAGVLEQDAYGLPFLRSMTTGANGERLAVSSLFGATQNYGMFAVAASLTTQTDLNAFGANQGVLALSGASADQRLNLMLGVNSNSTTVNNYYASTELDTGVSGTNERARWTQEPLPALTPVMLYADVRATTHKLRVNITDATDPTESGTHDPNIIPTSAELRTHMTNSGGAWTAPAASALYCAGIAAPLSESDRATLENNVFNFLKTVTGAEF